MKAGFAVLIGRSNVGKSTLLNTLVGTKIAATSFRAQMTRNIIHGVMNTNNGQAVFIDTPGIFKDKKDKLTAKLINKAKQALEGVDVIIYVVDPSREIGAEERYIYGLIRHLNIPKILVINKNDLPKNKKKYLTDYKNWSENFLKTFELSALKASHIQPLKETVIELLPESEAIYPQNQLTNIDNNFWVSEIIREKIFSVLDKEIPYSISVEVDEITEKDNVFYIQANILTDAERYKKIIIGKRGQKIKQIGQLARKELEQALNKKIFLDLEVKIDPRWLERLDKFY